MTTNTVAPTIPIVRVVRLSDVEPAVIPIPPPGTPRPTFAELAALEPQLARLEYEVKAWARTPLGDDWCANARWYGYGRFRGFGYRPGRTPADFQREAWPHVRTILVAELEAERQQATTAALAATGRYSF